MSDELRKHDFRSSHLFTFLVLQLSALLKALTYLSMGSRIDIIICLADAISTSVARRTCTEFIFTLLANNSSCTMAPHVIPICINKISELGGVKVCFAYLYTVEHAKLLLLTVFVELFLVG